MTHEHQEDQTRMSSKRITVSAVGTVEPRDLDGVLGFDVELTGPNGGSVTLTLPVPQLAELLTSVTFEGMAVARDFEYELGAAIDAGVQRRHREPAS